MLDVDINGCASLAAVFLFLTTLTLVLRLMARHRQRATIWIDDYLAVASYVGFIVLMAAFIYGMSHRSYGFPDPTPAVEEAQLSTVKQLALAVDAMEVWTYGTIKLSALYFYRRVFCVKGRKDPLHYLTIFFIAIVAAWTVTFFIMTFLLCGRHSVAWSISGGNIAQCKLVYPYFEAVAVSDFILDVFVLGIVLPRLWAIFSLSIKNKIAITCVLVLALGGIGASLARMIIYVHIVLTGRPTNDEDTYQVNTQMAYFAMLEAGFAFVSVNMVTAWYFVKDAKMQTAFSQMSKKLQSGRFSNRPSTGRQ